MLVILVVLLIVSTAARQKKKIKRRRDKIKNGFGDTSDDLYDTDNFTNAPFLFERESQNINERHIIDEITCSDLGLKDIYARLNRCMTGPGKDVLYCMLRMPGDGQTFGDEIKGFTEDKDRSVSLLYILDMYGRYKDCDDLKLIMSLKEAKERPIVYDILPPVLLLASIAFVSFAPLYGFMAVILMLAICIWSYFGGKRHMDDNLKGLALSLKLIRCSKLLLGSGRDEFEPFSYMFDLLKGNSLIPYKDKSTTDPLSIIWDYVRMITHIDLIAYNIKVALIKKHTEDLEKLYVLVGRLDAMLAVASYIYGKKHCRAKITGNCAIDAKGMYHPLVKDPVCNDLSSRRGMVLTGSNASGKSTFLKAVGINVLFAQSFGMAFADSFETGRFSLYTSMALNDNLLGEESYYVVEARSIKRIVDAAEKGMCLCIIDEVLRGTNTIERIAASSRILKHLCMPDVLCFAATHDIELANMLSNDMDLYHFTEEIHDDNVTFPFVIQRGYSTNTNAIRLLAMLGFDKSIVSSADELVEAYKKTGKWVQEK